MKTASEITSGLTQFIGTEQLHRWSVLFPDAITDGVLYLSTNAECFWLIDAIASWQLNAAVRAEFFQVWTLDVIGMHSATLLCDDGNGRTLARQPFGYTDFPLEHIKLYAVRTYDGGPVTIMLPSEY